MSLLISGVLSVLASVVVLVVGSALIEAMRRRGFDPITRFAAFLSPTDVNGVEGVAGG